MLVATRGESALDCIPFDDAMLDNALEDYSSDESTSHEKDDVDVITSELARIGKTGSQSVSQPTTQKPTQPATTKPQPTTQKPTTSSNVVVKATSNLFPSKTATFDKNTKTVTVSYDLTSAMNIVNGQWSLTYDTDVLSFDENKKRISVRISASLLKILKQAQLTVHSQMYLSHMILQAQRDLLHSHLMLLEQDMLMLI